MSWPIRLVLVAILLAVLGFAALETGFARRVFFAVFAYVKGVDIVAPTVVREPPTDSPYELWLARARTEIPMFEGLVIEDIARIALKPWPAMGEDISGLYLRFSDYQINDGRLLELPAGRHSVVERHLYEKGIYVVEGSGYTTVQQEGKAEDRVVWKAGDLFSIPLNVRHQHFNDGDGPARLLAVTSFPLVLNIMASEEFVTANPYVFEDRYDGAPGYFSDQGDAESIRVIANYIDDIRTTRTHPWDYRGEGNESASWDMTGNSMLNLHISQMPPRQYKKAHRHSSDAFILILSGQGFSLTWPEGDFARRNRVDWQAGTLFVPPTYWYHQHLNTGSTPARYLAINANEVIKHIGLRFVDQLEQDAEGVREEWERALERAAHTAE